MKKITKFTGIILVLTMVFALAAPCVSAEEVTPFVKQYGKGGGYLAIGDSISRGCGATENYSSYEGRYREYQFRKVPGAFPLTVAEAIGCYIIDDTAVKEEEINDQTPAKNNYWPFCFPGVSLSAVLDFVELGDNSDPYVHGSSKTKNPYANFGNMNKYFTRQALEGMISSVDLITVELGICDVFYRAQMLAADDCGADDLDFSTEYIEAFVKYLYEGYDFWLKNYTKLLDYIFEINPDVDLVMVGAYNMLSGIRIQDDMFLPVGDAFAVIPGLMNQQYRQWTTAYQAAGYHVAFADISNVETPANENDMTIQQLLVNGTLNTHPSINGNAYIARQVLDVLPPYVEDEELPEQHVDDPLEPVIPDTPIVVHIPFIGDRVIGVIPGKTITEVVAPNTDIVVDLGRFTKVNYVMVDNKIIKDKDISYSETNPYEMTVRYSSKNAKTLTVVVVQDDGKTAVYTYQLTYAANKGYTAYRLYSTNDAVNTATVAVTSFVTRTKTVIDTIKGLFVKK